MYLQRLEIQGFKSFANKTVLEFPEGPEQGRRATTITSIVGPNGSGKSCLADAVRWVLGEQSLKLLRAKKSADVIFSGSEKKARSGFAEATIYLDNADKRAPIDYSEIAITRRLYRNGENEYFLNKKKTKLQDILMLLAQANFGQRAYSVIGQGMIDAVLMQSPRERKDFFDEAAGVKQFQLKRHASVNKLKNTAENLKQVEVLLNEIGPRLRSLSRQVSKLEKHDEIIERLHSLEHLYYGTLWHRLQKKYLDQRGRIDGGNEKLKKLNQEIDELQKQFEQKESASRRKEGASEEFISLQAKYNELINKKNNFREKEFLNKERIASFRLQQGGNKEIPRSAIILELEQIKKDYQKTISAINDKTNPLKLKDRLEQILNSLDGLNKKIKNPAETVKVPEELTTALEAITSDIEKIDAQIKETQSQIENLRTKQKTEQTQFFEVQRKWRDRIEEKNILEGTTNELKIELARVETHKESLEDEMETHLKERKERIMKEISASPEHVKGQEQVEPHTLENQIQNLRYQLELIGGIDPETVKEYEETKERFDFLNGQSIDLAKASEKLKILIKELDGQIKTLFDTSFKKINAEFGKFFTILFDGGKASLEITKAQEHENIKTQEQEEIEGESKEELGEQVGIEIYANPPGKKVNSVSMLSGGERALTSIALICAIISSNPSPFVVLDEVDAALDESNSIRFAKIIEGLAHKTQFILVTHNRATMNIADILYGVTMTNNGTSQLLSLKLEEAEGLVNR
ncbi:AAA family ATPase [Patescibacteria group bacterium]|nr:AAA family ATPase [Patescibacteria group bacterium]